MIFIILPGIFHYNFIILPWIFHYDFHNIACDISLRFGYFIAIFIIMPVRFHYDFIIMPT